MKAALARNAPWVRTCVGCRKRAPAHELLRIVAVAGDAGPAGGRFRLMPDPARRLPGRGAHLHPDPRCLALAERRRAFGRALRISGVPDAGALVEWFDRNGKDRTTDMNTR
ncbi:MAG TPA: YlxR family protein [Natronosporangium sp.]